MLKPGEPALGWKKIDIGGPVYIVRRRTKPKFQLIVEDRASIGGLADGIHVDWKLECHKNYIFHRTENASETQAPQTLSGTSPSKTPHLTCCSKL